MRNLVESLVVSCIPWHVRVHTIKTAITIDIADGEYAIGMGKMGLITTAQDIETFHSEFINDDNGIFIRKPWGISGTTSQEAGTFNIIDSYPKW